MRLIAKDVECQWLFLTPGKANPETDHPFVRSSYILTLPLPTFWELPRRPTSSLRSALQQVLHQSVWRVDPHTDGIVHCQQCQFILQAEWREEVKKHFEKIKSEGTCIHRLDEELIRRRRDELRYVNQFKLRETSCPRFQKQRLETNQHQSIWQWWDLT